MNDKELLELAAKAVGIEIYKWLPDGSPSTFVQKWNPLKDDGDALRLAVKLHMDINSYPCTEEIGAVQHRHNGVCKGSKHRHFEKTFNQDQYSATRRAIVRAAAEIGKTL